MGKNIVLVGLMGAGKSSVGKLLSQKYSMDFVDIDEYIEQQEKLSISDIFANFGEKKFRQIEQNTILKISKENDKIISTGGGALENNENYENLSQNGILIYLKASPNVLYDRIKNETNLPLLMNENPLLTLENLLMKREQNYLKAQIIIDTTEKTAVEIADEIGAICKL